MKEMGEREAIKNLYVLSSLPKSCNFNCLTVVWQWIDCAEKWKERKVFLLLATGQGKKRETF